MNAKATESASENSTNKILLRARLPVLPLNEENMELDIVDSATQQKVG